MAKSRFRSAGPGLVQQGELGSFMEGDRAFFCRREILRAYVAEGVHGTDGE